MHRRAAVREHHRRRLALERLEDRSLMSASSWVAPGVGGQLVPRLLPNGDRILDFSNVGYRAGSEPIPTDIPVRATVAPRPGDDGDAIQTAIDAVSILPPDARGFRGVVRLAPGEYQVGGQLHLWASGVILRGSGDGVGGTVLRATGTSRRSLINVEGLGHRQGIGGRRQVLDAYVPVGARSLRVDSTAGLAVGDSIVVYRPSTQAWINAIGMNQLNNPWQPGTKDILFDRVITRVEGDRVTFDAPLANSLDRRFGGGHVVEYVWPGRIENVGVENLRGVSDFKWAADDNHAWRFVEVRAAQNAWIRGITTQNFAFGAVTLRASAKWVTVENARCLDPKSLVAGGRRYSFYIEGQQNLVRNAFSRGARHDFILGGWAAGPNVFVDCRAQGSLNDAGPHHRWSTGVLFDNVAIPGNQLNIRNRGNSGGHHGWTSANSVIWNSRAGGFIVESPPTATNWIIGSLGPVAANNMHVGAHPPGIYDSHGAPVAQRSLYYAQQAERQALPGLERREYRLGEIDQLRAEGEASTAAAWTDPAWLAEVSGAAGGRVAGMDGAATDAWVPLTFNFALTPGERVVGAALHLGVRATGAGVATNRVYFDSLTTSKTISELKWGAIPARGVAARSIDLVPYLTLLQDGKLNLALANDMAVDWASLDLQVVRDGTVSGPVRIPAGGDAFVHGGLHADSNYGSEAWLAVAPYTGTQEARHSYLSFDLAGIAADVSRAIVHLPVLAAGAGAVNSAVFVSGDWSEATINWNNQPAAGEWLGSWTCMAGDTTLLDVTAVVNRLRAQGASKFSLRIYASGGSEPVIYGSRESSPLTQPLLEIT